MMFQYELVPEDYAAFATNTYGGARASAKVGNSRFIYVVLVAGLIILRLASGERPGVGDAVWLVIALAWGLAKPWNFRRKMAARMRTAAQSDMSRSALGYRVLTVDDAGVTEQTELGSSRSWAGIERVDETPTHLFIYIGRQSAFIVPKSWLAESVVALRVALEDGMRPRATV